MQYSVEDLSEIISNAIAKYLETDGAAKKSVNARIKGTVPDLRKIAAGYGNDSYIKSSIKKIDEAILNTYDIDATKKFVCAQCNLSDNQFQVENRVNDGVVVPVITIILPPTITAEECEFVSKKMFTCGYSACTEPKYYSRHGVYAIVFEPMHGEDVTDRIRKECRYLFHATPTIYIDKIRKNGLCPMSRNLLFLYPSRIYCMKGDTLSKDQRRVYRNMQKVRSSRVDAGNMKNRDDNTYYLLTIDVAKIPENVKFMADPMAPRAIFTYDNIPPTAIVSYKRYNMSFNDIKNRIKKAVRRILKERTYSGDENMAD